MISPTDIKSCAKDLVSEMKLFEFYAELGKCNEQYKDQLAASEQEVKRLEINYADRIRTYHIEYESQVRDLTVEVERLKLNAEVLNLRLKTSQKLRDNLEAEALRLREALNKFGRHKSTCKCVHHDVPCTCGLDAAKAKKGVDDEVS